jgi:hypothetical protein
MLMFPDQTQEYQMRSILQHFITMGCVIAHLLFRGAKMTKAETALRKCYTSTCLRAIWILDHWTVEHRAKFREAYQNEDWKTVYHLCMDEAGTITPPDRMVLIHLIDATAPE